MFAGLRVRSCPDSLLPTFALVFSSSKKRMICCRRRKITEVCNLCEPAWREEQRQSKRYLTLLTVLSGKKLPPSARNGNTW